MTQTWRQVQPTPRATYDERTRTAFHEAGHVVVAVTFPCDFLCIDAVSIEEDDLYAGALRVRNDFWLDGHAAVALSAVLVAGFEAERLLVGAPSPEHARTDLSQAADLFEMVADGDPHRRDLVQRVVHARANALLRRHWPALCELTRALVLHETVTGGDARSIVARTPPAHLGSPIRAAS